MADLPDHNARDKSYSPIHLSYSFRCPGAERHAPLGKPPHLSIHPSTVEPQKGRAPWAKKVDLSYRMQGGPEEISRRVKGKATDHISNLVPFYRIDKTIIGLHYFQIVDVLVTFKSVYIAIFINNIVRPVFERRYLKMETHKTLPWSNRYGFQHRPQRI